MEELFLSVLLSTVEKFSLKKTHQVTTLSKMLNIRLFKDGLNQSIC